jgi:malonyl-CoA decarboxylase
MGDVGEKGLAEGAGFMVNYLYDLAAVEDNHEAFANHGEIVASAEVQRLRRTLETKPG